MASVILVRSVCLLAAGLCACTPEPPAPQTPTTAPPSRSERAVPATGPRSRSPSTSVVLTDEERATQLIESAQRDMDAGRLGEQGAGALPKLREALKLQPQDPRAQEGLAAVEEALLQRAEQAAEADDFAAASQRLKLAAAVRSESPDIAATQARIDAIRTQRLARWRDEGLVALGQSGGIPMAQRRLTAMMRIAKADDSAVTELRQRIDLAQRYGPFRPGQNFTDILQSGGRGPVMVAVPHGSFLMGASVTETGADADERPQHRVNFSRGFALSRSEVTVAEFRRFINATGHRSVVIRRGYSIVYDERSGNLVKRSGVDWQSDYTGRRAKDNQPVLHVTARDAEAYTDWLSKQSDERYRLPSESEFEYALRGGTQGRFPWGDGAVTPVAGNVTGAKDGSPSRRQWQNAFKNYGDGYWGPAPVASFAPNAYGLHDLAGNVSEWVADCWHDGYRRAPSDGAAWVNPGCRNRVVRGGSWASAPIHTRAAWRLGAAADTSNARLGFRVAREL